MILIGFAPRQRSQDARTACKRPKSGKVGISEKKAEIEQSAKKWRRFESGFSERAVGKRPKSGRMPVFSFDKHGP